MRANKGVLLHTVPQMNAGAALSGVGFLLYLGASALGWETAADLLAVGFSLAALYVLASVAEGRRRDRETVSYNLLWGQAALTLLLAGCALLTVKLRLGL